MITPSELIERDRRRKEMEEKERERLRQEQIDYAERMFDATLTITRISPDLKKVQAETRFIWIEKGVSDIKRFKQVLEDKYKKAGWTSAKVRRRKCMEAVELGLNQDSYSLTLKGIQ